MDTPQEVEVWVVLPALRRQLAVSLKKIGLKQKEIASVFNLTEAAVSQYLKKKRGSDASFGGDIELEIIESAKTIAKDRNKTRYELQRLVRLVAGTRRLCTICRTHIPTEKGCEICYA